MEKTEKKQTAILNFGAKGWIIVILGFASSYLYSALTSDSLNVTIGAFGERGMNTNMLYSMSTIATICGIVASIALGKLMSMRTASLIWGISSLLICVFSLIWSRANTVAVYAIGYLVCYSLALCCAMLLSFQVIGNWFPRKRDAACGFATAGMPLSAATTTAICTAMLGTRFGIGGFYILMAIIAGVIGLIILLYSKDFPEEKGAFPDNDRNFDFETAKKEHEQNLEYLKTSKWTIGKCLTTGRMWVLWVAIGITGFISMGIMSNFMGKFLEQGYETPTILIMLTVVGVVCIPGSLFVGWLGVRFGTKYAGILINVLAVLTIIFNLTPFHILHFISLPMLSCFMGGSSNMMVSCTSAIWGRYDFQNAFRVIQPLNAIMTGVGITVVGVVGTNFGYMNAYWVMLFLSFVGLIAMLALKVKPIDNEVR